VKRGILFHGSLDPAFPLLVCLQLQRRKPHALTPSNRFTKEDEKMKEKFNGSKATSQMLDSIGRRSLSVLLALHERMKDSAYGGGYKPVTKAVLAANKDRNRCYMRRSISVGDVTSGKGVYVWVDVRYKGLDCTISSVWTDVDGSTWNIHQYPGQICFIRNIGYNDGHNSLDKKPSTTIWDMLICANEFKEFLNTYESNRRTDKDGVIVAGYRTVSQRQRSCGKPQYEDLTTDSFFINDTDNVCEGKICRLIKLFEVWAETELDKLAQIASF
jgi:hypothetical protein